jgi:RNA polymerase sigma-70 factor, ECF subfamily
MASTTLSQARQKPRVGSLGGTVLQNGRRLYDGRTHFQQRRPSQMADPSRPKDPDGFPKGSPERQPEAESSIALLLRARDGDDGARDQLLARYLPRLQRWAHSRLPPWARGDAETGDLVQDTLVQVVQKIRGFQPEHEGAFYGYVRQALLNRIRDEIRRAQRRAPTDALDSAKPAIDPSPLEYAIGQEALENYEAALQRLSEGDRQAIILRIELGLSVPEVAQALGKPTTAATHMAISRALTRLAKEMSHGPRS